jgi:hypothetical protein
MSEYKGVETGTQLVFIIPSLQFELLPRVNPLREDTRDCDVGAFRHSEGTSAVGCDPFRGRGKSRFLDSGGIASLNRRLMAGNPSGSDGWGPFGFEYLGWDPFWFGYLRTSSLMPDNEDAQRDQKEYSRDDGYLCPGTASAKQWYMIA